jgi:hypothetical protein
MIASRRVLFLFPPSLCSICLKFAIRNSNCAILADASFLALCSLLLARCSTVQAQQVTKIPRIGVITGISTDPSSRIEIFRQALQELGYLEGKNISLEYRDNERDRSRVPGIVAELVRLKVDVLIVTIPRAASSELSLFEVCETKRLISNHPIES